MSKKLFTPGPSNVPEHIRIQLSKDIMHHRMNDYHRLFFQVTKKLKQVFETQVGKMLVLTTSGTGAMESTVVNLFSKGDRVLVINTGFFGQRFIEICQVYGLEVITLDYSWGETYTIDDVINAFSKHPNIKGVFLTHHETSTGVVNDVKTVGDFVATTDALLITDCISGMIAHPFKFDEWKVDCAVASSQKGFGLPPGLSFVALSNKAEERLADANLPKYYFDYQKYLQAFKKGENPFTPAISLVIALDIALNTILEKGIEVIIQEKEQLRQYTEQQLEAIGFELFITDASIRGNVLVPVLLGPDLTIDLKQLVTYLDERYNIQVSLGQGAFVDRMLRVGLISDFTEKDVNELVEKVVKFINLSERND